MNPVLKEIIKSLRDNWQEWEYTITDDLLHKDIHWLIHKRFGIKIYITRRRRNLLNNESTEFADSSLFRCAIGFWSGRKLTKAMEFCIAKIIAKKLEPEKGEIVEKPVRHLDLDD